MDIILIASLVLVVGIVGCIILGVPIAVGIGLSSFAAAMVLLDFDRAALVSAQRMFTGINSFTLLAIPFFVLAGVLMNSGGIAGRLIDAAKVLSIETKPHTRRPAAPFTTSTLQQEASRKLRYSSRQTMS